MRIDTPQDLQQIGAWLPTEEEPAPPPEPPKPPEPPESEPDDGLPPAQEGERLRDATDALLGCLLGAAVGGAIGLPRDRLTRIRARLLFGSAPLRYQFLGRRGMVSDDAEHAYFTAQALIEARGSVERFPHCLARQLQLWLLGAPAGVDRATLQCASRLWLGWPPHRTGVDSAGSGAAMRAPLIGTYAADDTEQLLALVRASTTLTHRDPRAWQGSLLLALAAQQAAQPGPVSDAPAFLACLRPHITDVQLGACLAKAAAHLAREASAEEFADALGLREGVTEFVNDTVPVALYCWLRYPSDFRLAVEQAVLLGGETATAGAFVGALSATALGIQAIPIEWLRGLFEWPHSVTWMRQLATRLAESRWPSEAPPQPLPHQWPRVFARNLLYSGVLLLHAGRRLLPPH